MTKHKRTQEDWIKIGTSLKKVRNELLHVDVLVSNQVGVTNKSYKKIAKALALVDQARSELEDQMFRENPYLSNYWLHSFYDDETTNFDPDSEEAKRYEPDPLHLKKITKEER